MKSPFRFAYSIAVFAITMMAGYTIVQNSWDGVVFLKLNPDERIPAAIKRSNDLSNYKGIALLKASQERLITSSKVIHHPSSKIAVLIGHFITTDPETNRRVSACDIYEKVEITLSAVGVATAGSAPTMTIEAPCKISSDDLNTLEPIWINAKEIIKHPPGNHEFLFKAKYESHIKFLDVIDAWPTEWQIQTVKMLGSIKGKADVIDVSVSSLPAKEQTNQDRVLNLK